MFFCNLWAFRMADNTTQVESRITKIKILWIYNYVDSETIYLFKIWPGEFQSTEERLFNTENEAREFSKDKISKIAITLDLQEEEEKEEVLINDLLNW